LVGLSGRDVDLLSKNFIVEAPQKFVQIKLFTSVRDGQKDFSQFEQLSHSGALAKGCAPLERESEVII
jgi:hypothetical protein